MSIATKCTCGHSFTFCTDGVTECHHQLPSFPTPPSEAEGQGEWINASKEIPDESNKRIKWRDANSHAEISTTAARSAIHTDQAEFVEWYKSHPAPSGPVEKDYNNLYCAAHSALAKIKVRCLHFAQSGNPKLLEQIQELAINTLAEIISMKQPSPDPNPNPNPPFIVQSDAGPVEGPWKDGITDHDKESALIEYLGGKPTPAPVEADFETAMEAQLDTREENGFGLDSRHQNFEEGAKWAREYLTPKPVEGPWKDGITDHDKESALIEYLGGKPTPAPVEADFETAMEAEISKLPMEPSLYEYTVADIFELGAKWARQHLKSQQAGARWVRASERLPKDDRVLHLKVDGIPKLGNLFRDNEYAQFYIQGVSGFVVPPSRFGGIEWLDESDSPAPEQVDPVEFAKFVMQDPSVILRGKIDFDRLLSKYITSLQNKQS